MPCMLAPPAPSPADVPRAQHPEKGPFDVPVLTEEVPKWSDGVPKHDVSLEGNHNPPGMMDHQPHFDMHLLGGVHLPLHGAHHTPPHH